MITYFFGRTDSILEGLFGEAILVYLQYMFFIHFEYTQSTIETFLKEKGWVRGTGIIYYSFLLLHLIPYVGFLIYAIPAIIWGITETFRYLYKSFKKIVQFIINDLK